MKNLYTLAAMVALSIQPCVFAQPQDAASASPTQTPAAGPAVVPAEQQATREQLTRLFEVMRLRQQFNQIMTMMPKAVEQGIHEEMQQAMAQMPAAQQPTADQQAQLDAIMDKYMQKAMNIYPADEMMADAIGVYQRHMSRTDVDAYIAFYTSPPGQHLLDAQPAIMKEYMPIVMAKAQDRSKALYAEMLQDLANFEKNQKPQPATAPAK